MQGPAGRVLSPPDGLSKRGIVVGRPQDIIPGDLKSLVKGLSGIKQSSSVYRRGDNPAFNRSQPAAQMTAHTGKHGAFNMDIPFYYGSQRLTGRQQTLSIYVFTGLKQIDGPVCFRKRGYNCSGKD
jgi:hypothetical protein